MATDLVCRHPLGIRQGDPKQIDLNDQQVTTDGRYGTWKLDRYAKGSAFQVACRLLSDPDLDDALRGYPISATPICTDGYDPPLPEWLEEARDALGLPR